MENIRERYLSLMRFQLCTKTPRWEFAYYSGTIQRWYDEGLPGSQQAIRFGENYGDWVPGGGHAVSYNKKDEIPDEDVKGYFNMDEGARAVSLEYSVWPPYETEVLEETDKYIITKGADGITQRTFKDRDKVSLPHPLDYPVHNRQEWEQFKAERYQPNLKERLPDNWEELSGIYKNREFPLIAGHYPAGFFGTVRQILGFEKTIISFYDDPDWMHDMMDYLSDFYISLYDQLLNMIDVDMAFFWEDMCYNTGPMISPQMFSDFILEPYKKVTGFFRDNGVDLVMVDCDGDVSKLIPLFIEGGVTSMYPFEANSTNSDVREIRGNHPNLGIQGGINKLALIEGKEAIDKELENKVPVVLSNGYVPHVDHAVPPEVSWDNFCYYRNRLDEMLDDYDGKKFRI
jgi:uroporphyrinogen decarboxylase